MDFEPGMSEGVPGLLLSEDVHVSVRACQTSELFFSFSSVKKMW